MLKNKKWKITKKLMTFETKTIKSHLKYNRPFYKESENVQKILYPPKDFSQIQET